MTILLDDETRVIVQGVTGATASAVAADMLAYGTDVVAGVSPGRAGQVVNGLPVFDYVADAIESTGARTSLVFVPPPFAAAAIDEALQAGIKLLIYPGDGLPIQDTARIKSQLKSHDAILVGPNTPGLISPGKAKIGFMPSFCFERGPVGVISKSGSLSYEVCSRLTQAGVGQSTVVGIGGDPVKGLSAERALSLFHHDPETRSILFLGEIGGLVEYQVAQYALQSGAKPVTAFIAGRSAPKGRKMGHAAAIISGPAETYEAKTQMLGDSGIAVAPSLRELPRLVRESIVRVENNGKRGN